MFRRRERDSAGVDGAERLDEAHAYLEEGKLIGLRR